MCFKDATRALVVEDEAALFPVINYIHLNPVAAKIVEPCDWRIFGGAASAG